MTGRTRRRKVIVPPWGAVSLGFGKILPFSVQAFNEYVRAPKHRVMFDRFVGLVKEISDVVGLDKASVGRTGRRSEAAQLEESQGTNGS